MRMTSQLCTGLFALIIFGTGDLYGQDVAKDTSTKQDVSSKHSTLKIVAEPKTSRPFDWKVGGRVTIGVRCHSKDSTRVIGVATDITLVTANEFENRVEMEVQGETSAIKKIAAAAKISEYWFEVMPFSESHLETLKSEVDIADFLKTEPSFRPVTEKEWGYGAADGRLLPPGARRLACSPVEAEQCHARRARDRPSFQWDISRACRVMASVIRST